MAINSVSHQFVEFMPEKIEEGILYVSVQYATAIHLCCCGCKSKVVTPLTPKDWKLIFDGETVSLYPSIGNWSFKCQSHYWIREGEVKWAETWSKEEIESNRIEDKNRKSRAQTSKEKSSIVPKKKKSFWGKLFSE